MKKLIITAMLGLISQGAFGSKGGGTGSCRAKSKVHHCCVEYYYDSTLVDIENLQPLLIEQLKKVISQLKANETRSARLEKKSIYGLDWNKIEVDLTKNNIINKGRKNNLNFKWLKSKDLSNFIEKKIIDNPYYLVKKNIK